MKKDSNLYFVEKKRKQNCGDGYNTDSLSYNGIASVGFCGEVTRIAKLLKVSDCKKLMTVSKCILRLVV